MQNINESYLLEIKKPSRSFECRITIGDNIYTNSDIINITIEDVQPNDGFNIGTAVSKSLELTLSTDNVIYSTSIVKVEIGLLVGSTIEYVLMGYFNIDDIEKTDYSTKLTCYDNMMKFEKPYFSNLGETASLQNIVNELSEITGVEFTGGLPSYNLNKLEGFTCREMLGYIASLCAGNAYITREGKFTIKTPAAIDYSITDENYINLKTEEDIYKIGSVTCKANETELTKGDLSNSTMEVTFENPWVNDSILTDIYNKLRDFEYIGYSMKWQGDLTLDVGDIISLTDNKGIKRNIPILSQRLNYNGGLTSEIGAKGQSKNKNEFSSTGNLNNKVNRVVTELLLVNKALINKADISDLNAVNIKTQVIEGNIAKLETIINGNLTSDNIHSLILTSSKVTVENGFIKNAMIENVDVSKVNAGDISTNKFRIVSDSGKMLIADNTIQIKDNNRVRVQIGKDASNDYSMYVWDSSGKLMFDAAGLKADGIKNKIIRDDMISDNANIDGGKLNISSVVTSINNGTTTINSTKIQLNEKNQTLEVAFNSMSNTVNGHTSTIGSHTTSIGVMQGQITGLISDTTIVEDGTNKKIKDVYTSLKATVNGISSKVSSVESSFNNFQIGGRNLILNSGFTNGTNGFSIHLCQNISVVDADTARSKKAITFTSTGGGIYYRNVGNTNGDKSIPYPQGQKLVVSGYFKSSSTAHIRIGLEGVNKEDFIPNGANTWTKFELQVTANGTAHTFTFYGVNGNQYHLKDLKLEIGTKATDWTPAPEDVDSSINAVDTKVTALDVTVKNTSSKVSVIEQNMESITQRVSSTETKVTTVTNTANTAKTQADKAIADAKTASDKATAAQNSANNANNALTLNQQTKMNGVELFNNEYKSNISAKPFSYGTYSIVPATEITGADANESNIIKVIDGQRIYTDYIACNIDNPYYVSIEVYNKETNNGSVYVQVCYYDKDKVALATNDAAVSAIGNVVIPSADAWHKLEGWANVPAINNVRKKAKYVRIRVLNRYNGLTGVTYYRNISWKQLGSGLLADTQETKTEIATTKSKVSTIETNLSGITQRVSTVETKQTTTDGKVTSLETWKKSAEVKITDSAIVSTVTKSATYKNDLNGKVNSNSIISSINQTAESIKIDASKINLTGYVTMTNLSTLGQTSIDGGNIKTNTIVADKIAIGDFNNYVVLEPNATFTGTSGTTEGYEICSIKGSEKYNNANLSNKLYGTNGGDKFRVKAMIKSDTAGSRLDITCCWRNSNNEIVSSSTIYGTISTANTWIEINDIITVPSRPSGASYVRFKINIQSEQSRRIYVERLSITRMYGGELIVDGSITTNKLSADAIDGRTIKGAIIVGGELRGSSNFFTSPDSSSVDGYAFRIYSSGELHSNNFILTSKGDNYSRLESNGIISCSKQVNTPAVITGGQSLWLGIRGVTPGSESNFNFELTQQSDKNVYFRPGYNGQAILGHPAKMFNKVYAVNGVSSSSDRTLKENIKYLNTTTNPNCRIANDITELDLYNFVKNDLITAIYNFIGDDKQHIGFIAQDLLYNIDGTDNIIGQLIVNKPDNERSPLSYNEKIYSNVLAGALRHAISIIEDSNEKIMHLENRLEELDKIINKIIA